MDRRAQANRLVERGYVVSVDADRMTLIFPYPITGTARIEVWLEVEGEEARVREVRYPVAGLPPKVPAGAVSRLQEDLALCGLRLSSLPEEDVEADDEVRRRLAAAGPRLP